MSNPKSKIQNLKSTGLCRVLFETAGDAILVLQQGQIVECNAGAATLFNCAQEDLLGQPLLNFAPPLQLGGFASAQSLHEKTEAASAGEVQRFEWLYQPLQGDIAHAEVVLNTIDFENNQYVQLLMRDVTESVHVEELLREREARARNIVGAILDAVVVMDEKGIITEWNSQAEAIFGWTQSEAVGRTVADTIIPPQYQEAHRQGMKHFLETGEGPVLNQRIEITAIHRDGHEFPIELAISPFKQGEGWVFSSFIRDISRRKQQEEELRKLSRAVEQSASVVLITNTQGNIEYVNSRFVQITGYQPEEVIGKNPRILKSGDIDPARYKILWETIMAGNEWRGEFRNKKKNDEFYWVSASISPIKDARGVITHFLAVEEDITHRKQAEEELRNYQDQLEDLVKARTAELEDSARELNALQRLMSREGWQAFTATQEQTAPGYLFDQTSVQPITAQDVGNGHSLPDAPAQPAAGNGHALTRSMAVRGETIGQIGVYDDPDHPLTPEDQEFLDSIAAQVAEALERARLLEQTQKRAIELEAVAQVSTVASTALQTSELLQSVVDLTKSNFGLYHAHIYLLNDAKDTLVLRAGSGQVGRQMVSQGWSLAVDQEHSLVARVARTRQGLIVNDVRAEPDFLPNPLLPDTRSEMAVPMVIGGSVLGVLDVQAASVNHFTDEDVRIQTTLATQVAVALQNSNLFTQTQAALTETENLYDASRRIIAAGNLQEVVAAIAESGPVPAIDRVLLVSFEQDATGEIDAMTVTANWHDGAGPEPSSIGTRYPRAMFAAVGILLSSEPIFFDDVQRDPRVDPATREVLQQLNISSMAILPLWVGARQLGALLLESSKTHHFTERQIQPYITLAGQAAVAIENQRLLEETSRALAEAETAQRRYTIQAWEAYRARTSARSYEQLRDDFIPSGNELPAEVSEAVANQQTVVVSALPGLPGEGQAEGDNNKLSPQAAQSSLVVPLAVRGEVIGVFGLQETDSTRQWTPEEIGLVEAIAEQISQAAENIRLLDDSQQRAARERRVNEIGEKIQAAQSLEEALQIAVKEVGLSLQAPQTQVQFLLPDTF